MGTNRLGGGTKTRAEVETRKIHEADVTIRTFLISPLILARGRPVHFRMGDFVSPWFCLQQESVSLAELLSVNHLIVASVL